MRVRSFSQDDAHIFCRPDQIQDEIHGFMDMLSRTYRMLGFEDVHIALSTRPDHRAGTDEIWDRAEETLSNVLDALQIEHEVVPGEGAFYGPKVDVFVNDALRRPWQLGTCQLDFNLPEQFGLEYTTEDGTTSRPAMIHRAMLGSIERFLGVYIEHCAGAFPTWLAPVQAVVIGITDQQNEYVTQVAHRIGHAGLRVETDTRNEKVGYKIREAEVQKIPYMLVTGAREEAAGKVAVRMRGTGDQGTMDLNEVIQMIQDDIRMTLATSSG